MTGDNDNFDIDHLIFPRESAKAIANNLSKDVKIMNTGVKMLALKLSNYFIDDHFSLSNWKKHTLHPSIPDEAAVEFIFAMDILNFSFWPDENDEKFTVIYDGIAYTGYWSLVAALRRAQDDSIPVSDARFMSSVDKKTLEKIFRSDTTGSIPMLAERVKAFNEAGTVLLDKFNGSFVNCVRMCENDAVKLLKIMVSNFKSLQDVCCINGKMFSFLKRAQIIVADVWSCFEGSGLGYFKNIDQLTMFADYRVPQVLEYFDVLSYSPALKEVLQKGTLLQSGCSYEVEIRGNSIHAIEVLKSEVLNELIAKNVDKTILDFVNSVTIDFYLWDYAKSHREQMKHLAFHHIRTVYY